jgi:hypothetical protein
MTTVHYTPTQYKVFKEKSRLCRINYTLLGRTLLNSSRSESAMQASQALRGSQLRVFSSPSLRGPLRSAVQYSAVQYSMREVSRGKCLLCEKAVWCIVYMSRNREKATVGNIERKLKRCNKKGMTHLSRNWNCVSLSMFSSPRLPLFMRLNVSWERKISLCLTNSPLLTIVYITILRVDRRVRTL